jgi:PadR family transcriptional regulator, regulatory protein AphA
VADIRLTPTSFAVLGLIEALGPTTPYDLKRFGQGGVFHIWSIPHTQLYSECARLGGAGFLDEEQETTGRRRRVYRLTGAGRRALDDWRGDPATEVFEFRDEGLLKLYFGADRRRLAETQIEQHIRRVEFLRAVHEGVDLPEGMRSVLEAGIGHGEEFVRFWRQVRDREARRQRRQKKGS